MVENNRKNLQYKEMLNTIPDVMVAFPLRNIPEIKPGDNLGEIITNEMSRLGGVMDFDIFVVASKIVSKSEGRTVDLKTVHVSETAYELHRKLGRKTPELIQLILDNSISYVVQNGIILSKHTSGFIITSAGVDGLNNGFAILLPEDPDQSAKNIQNEIERQSKKQVAIVISDSEGRPDRKGAGAISIGVAGIDPLRIKEIELENGLIKKTEETISDMLAAQASLLMGQRGNEIPIVCIRGFSFQYNPAATLKSIIHT